MKRNPLILIIGLLGLYTSLAIAPVLSIPANTPSFADELTLATPIDLSTWENENSWPMVAANPERTSWTPEEVRGDLEPLWYKPIEPYISQRVQIIAAYNMLYVSTANGLYALDSITGAEVWIYPTELPLGHSPTVYNGVIYVGGFDRKLHAIDAFTGQVIWTFMAQAGFQTNPLVIGDKVYLGNRDGTFYSIYISGAHQGTLAWKFKTQGSILYSAAYKDGLVFFASNDSYAYALNAQTGQLVWRSAKLPGSGFYSWWPVIYQDRVIFSGNNNYRSSTGGPGPGKSLAPLELEELYPDHATIPKGTLIGALTAEPGDWASGTPTIDASPILDYFDAKPWRKTVFVLDRFTGIEQEIAPTLWAGNDHGNRYPPVVGADNVLYQQNNYMSSPGIQGGQISGWQPGNTFISVVSSDWGATDEPHAASAGGDLVYWNLCCDRQAGAFDVTLPNTRFADRYQQGFRPPTGNPDNSREWKYFSYHLHDLIPGYNVGYYNPNPSYTSPHAAFGSPNGVYGFHNDVNPPIPYNGRVYMHRGNSIIAFGTSGGVPISLPLAATVTVQNTEILSHNLDYLREQLTIEVSKMLQAGRLRPGFMSHGLFDHHAQDKCGDDLVDYWHHPAETIYTLLQTVPYLPVDLQSAVEYYIQNEFNAYPPYQINHVGWRDGAARDDFLPLPEVETDRTNFPPESQNNRFVWQRNPYHFYVLWKYAEQFGDALGLYQASHSNLEEPPSDEILLKMPFVHNAFIAGYLGYLELEQLAGEPESPGVRDELERLINLRTEQFTKDSAYAHVYEFEVYCRTLSVASNFMFLVPELAQHLREDAWPKVQAALLEYEAIAPYWFVSFADEGYAEGPKAPLYDAHSLFMAHALILQEPGDVLQKYLDVPAFARGDLFYIQKLVTTIEATEGFFINVNPSMQAIEAGGSANYIAQLQATGDYTPVVTLDITMPITELAITISPTVITSYEHATFTVTDTQIVTTTATWYMLPVTAVGQDDLTQTTTIRLLVNGSFAYLPLINKP